MLPQGADAAEHRPDYDGGMTRVPAALLAALVALPALGQGGLEPSGRLPPTPPPPAPSPEHAKPVELPSSTPSRGTVLEQVTGTVKEVDRKAHRIVVETAGDRVTLSLDRNTMVYTSGGLGTVLDVIPGAQIRAGRNADMVAYWVQIRPSALPGAPAPVPGQGTGPAGGAAAPAAEPRGGAVSPPAGPPVGPGVTPGGH
jgi:hypothetical protein